MSRYEYKYIRVWEQPGGMAKKEEDGKKPITNNYFDLDQLVSQGWEPIRETFTGGWQYVEGKAIPTTLCMCVLRRLRPSASRRRRRRR